MRIEIQLKEIIMLCVLNTWVALVDYGRPLKYVLVIQSVLTHLYFAFLFFIILVFKLVPFYILFRFILNAIFK